MKGWVLLGGVLCCVGCAGSRPPPRFAGAPLPPGKGAAYYYLLSEIDAQSNDRPRMLENLTKAIEKADLQGDVSHLYYKRAALYASMGELSRAEQDLGEALALSPEHAPSLTLLGRVYQTQQRLKEALRVYQKALRSDPASEEINVLLIEASVAAKEYGGALNLIRSWERADPEGATPLFYEAWLQQNILKSQERALEAYKRILVIDPDNLKALSSLAEIYLRQKDEQKVLETFRRMEALSPNDTSLQLKIALIYYENKKYEQAIEKFKGILQAYPEADRILYYLGVIYENLKRDDEAQAAFEKIKPSSSFFQDAVLHRAFLKHRVGESEEALRILDESLRAKPSVGLFYEYASEIYRDRKNYRKASEILKKGIARSSEGPEKESLYYHLGMIQDRLGDLEASMRSMKEVLKINPKNPSALNYIGYSYADRGMNLEEALDLVQKALALKPDDGYITDSLGWVYFKKGDFEKAARYLRRAYDSVKAEPTITEHMGDLHLAKNEKAQALRYFEEALRTLEKENEDFLQRDRERLREKIRKIKNENK